VGRALARSLGALVANERLQRVYPKAMASTGNPPAAAASPQAPGSGGGRGTGAAPVGTAHFRPLLKADMHAHDASLVTAMANPSDRMSKAHLENARHQIEKWLDTDKGDVRQGAERGPQRFRFPRSCCLGAEAGTVDRRLPNPDRGNWDERSARDTECARVETTTTIRGPRTSIHTERPRLPTPGMHPRDARSATRAVRPPTPTSRCGAQTREGTARTSHRRGPLDILIVGTQRASVVPTPTVCGPSV